jgi:asparagine synthase (glutamine-hydrolysing)
MCGIAGKISYRTDAAVTRDLLNRMERVLHHRGPDAGGVYLSVDRRVGFAHRRLSIIDLSGGSQPMADVSGDLVIVFNGEIYNFPELRAELEGRGHQFASRSDTEVILHLYREYGEGSFRRLNGIFAFAIHDRLRDRVILARDHFGVKPLYYSTVNGALVFGSEVKAILEDPAVPRTLDLDAFDTFLTLRYSPSPMTLIDGVRKLHPGHCLLIERDREPELRAFWTPAPRTNHGIHIHEAVQEYRRLLEKAVRRQMLSDVPVGLLLSGGIDSAVIGTLMREGSRGPIPSFTIGFKGRGDYNELDDARASARFLGSEHFGLEIGVREYLEFFPRSFEFTEEPIAETTIPALYYVSRLAAEHVKVVLAGQGADEPLAGYHRYIGEKYLSSLAPLFRFLPLRVLASLLPRNERLKRASYASGFTDEVQRFVAIYTLFTPEQKLKLVLPELRKRMRDRAREIVGRLHASTTGMDETLSRLVYIDTRLSLPDNLLLFGDKMSMANSLEMRVPFLDLELVEFLESLPASFKLRGRKGKYIHKLALKKWLPDEIIGRPKRGFDTPMDEWLQGELAHTARRLILESDSACRRYFHVEYISEMISSHISRRENFQRHIFALLSFEIWHRVFLERRSVSLL